MAKRTKKVRDASCRRWAEVAKALRVSERMLRKIRGKTDWPVSRDLPLTPADLDALRRWRNGGTEPVKAEPNEDPWKPPPAEVLNELKVRNPEKWATILRKMKGAEKTRFDLAVSQGRYISRDEADAASAARVGSLRTAMKQLAAKAPRRLADLIAAKLPEADEKALAELEREIERELTHAFEALCNHLAHHADDPGIPR